jgi:hypothetical protein
MEAMELHMPGYRINEYRLVIPISTALQDRIQHLRKELYEKNKLSFPFQLKPSLTVATFHAYAHVEERLTDRLQQIALGLNPFKVEMQNFSAYPTHTIYIDVPTRQPFHEVVRELKAIRSLIKVPEHEPHFIKEPHLLIAHKLKPFQFNKMWMECEHKQFTGRCIADNLLLLKKSHISNRYEVVKSMEFMSLPVLVRQGELFG